MAITGLHTMFHSEEFSHLMSAAVVTEDPAAVQS